MSRSRGAFHHVFVLALGAWSALLLGARCAGQVADQVSTGVDAMLDGDWLDPRTGTAAEIVPGAPFVAPGPDGEWDTNDDLVRPDVRGDIDLVIRSGMLGFAGGIPAPSALAGDGALPEGVAEPFGEAVPIDFVVVPSDGGEPAPYGTPVSPPYFHGLPVLVLAFGDLDGDGYIGRTRLDGDDTDGTLEEAELEPLARRYATGYFGKASGKLTVSAGGPPGAPLRIALAAVAYAGPFSPDHFGGIVPLGPAVMTHLPFFPDTNPDKVIGRKRPPRRARTNDLVPIEIDVGYLPDPGDPRVGEAFTLPLDGSSPSIDAARVHSGRFERFGLVRRPDPASYRNELGRALRPGLDASGAPAVYEVLTRLVLADDGAGNALPVRVVPLDRLGNVTGAPGTRSVTVRSGGVVRIVSPDFDGDPSVETVSVADARGVELHLDDAGGVFDDADVDFLEFESGDSFSRIGVYFPDPDVDDSGVVDGADVDLVRAHFHLRIGDVGFDPRFDLDGDGRIRGPDLAVVNRNRGRIVPDP